MAARHSELSYSIAVLNSLPPRFLCDFTVPCRPDDSFIEACRNEADYQTYVRWLSDYLHTVDLPLSEEQQDWLIDNRPDSEKVIFECSDFPGYANWQLESLMMDFEAGKTYANFRAECLRLYETELRPEDREIEGPFEDFLDCSEAVYDRLFREYQAEKAIGREWSHPDMPYRSLLSWALQKMPEAEKRYQQVNFYFVNFSENASK